MFNKYFVQIPDTEGPKEIARATRELGNKLEKISEAEIKSKDRVDISVSEYLKLRDDVSKMDAKIRHMEYLFKQLGITPDTIDDIVPDTVEVYYNEDIRDFVRHCMIKFDIAEDVKNWRVMRDHA